MFDNLIAAVLLTIWFEEYSHDCYDARGMRGPMPTRSQFIQANTGRRFGPITITP